MAVDAGLRVLVADDHLAIRRGIRLALEGDGLDVCAECGDADSAVAAALVHRPHVALIDLHMPGDGLSAVRRIHAADVATAIVVLTFSDETRHVRQAFEAGAAGYLLKDVDPGRLGLIVRRIAAGEMALPRSLTAPLLRDLLARGTARRVMTDDGAVELTPQETTILELLHEGKSTAEIARALHISSATVRSHVSRTVKKLNADDRSSATALLDEALGRSAA